MPPKRLEPAFHGDFPPSTHLQLLHKTYFSPRIIMIFLKEKIIRCPYSCNPACKSSPCRKWLLHKWSRQYPSVVRIQKWGLNRKIRESGSLNSINTAERKIFCLFRNYADSGMSCWKSTTGLLKYKDFSRWDMSFIIVILFFLIWAHHFIWRYSTPKRCFCIVLWPWVYLTGL